jgi:hypothetical protein
MDKISLTNDNEIYIDVRLQDDKGNLVCLAESLQPLTLEDEKIIEDFFEVTCNCSHDCCGHTFGGIKNIIKEYKEYNNYVIICGYSKNY